MKRRAGFYAVGMAVLMVGLLMLSGPAAGQAKGLTVYGSTQEMGVRHITEAFTKDTGIKVD